MTASETTAERADPGAPESLALVRAMEDEIDDLYRDRSGSVRSVTAEPEEMRPPDGDFLVVVHEGRPVGCGGLKRLDRDACEIKRMYVAPELRGRGMSMMLLDALEERARELGFTMARLDMADRQPAARRLYEGAGYRRIPAYNENDLATHWYERPLRPDEQAVRP